MVQVSYDRYDVLNNGLEFTSVFYLGSGLPDPDVDSATISIYGMRNGAQANIITDVSMTQASDGSWYYRWVPSDRGFVQRGNYTILYSFTKGSDVYPVYDEFSITCESNNDVWYSDPQSGTIFNRKAPSANNF